MKNDNRKTGKVKSSINSVSPLVASVGKRLWKAAVLLSSWLIEVSAFVLLPLVIYIVTFLTLGRSVREAMNSPELMFVTIILYGEVLKREVLFYRRYRGFVLKFNRTLAFGLMGISVSSVLLCFSLIHEKNEIPLSETYYPVFRGVVFVCALILSASEKVSTGLLRGDSEGYSILEERPEGVRDEHG